MQKSYSELEIEAYMNGDIKVANLYNQLMLTEEALVEYIEKDIQDYKYCENCVDEE